MTRRWTILLLLIVLALVVAACGDDAEETTTTAPPADTETTEAEAPDATEDEEAEVVTLRVASLPIGDLGAYFYALEHGIFEEHNLVVEDTSATGGAAAISAMTGGEVDIVYTNNVSVIVSAEQGLPITIVSGANFNQPEGEQDMAAMMVPSDITSADQLAGQTVASNALNNINWLYARVWLRDQGVDPDQVQYTEIPFPEQPAALLEGRIQGTLIPEPFRTNLLREGANSLGFPYRVGEGERTFIASFVSTPEFAEQNAEAIERFKDALQQAIDEIGDDANRERFEQALLNNTRLEQEALGEIVFPEYTTEIPMDALEEMAAFMQEEGILDQVPDLEALVFEP
jgi:NitT/TauT family transport system substrate-binding protein